jgi:hypothetical protein
MLVETLPLPKPLAKIGSHQPDALHDTTIAGPLVRILALLRDIAARLG